MDAAGASTASDESRLATPDGAGGEAANEPETTPAVVPESLLGGRLARRITREVPPAAARSWPAVFAARVPGNACEFAETGGTWILTISPVPAGAPKPKLET